MVISSTTTPSYHLFSSSLSNFICINFLGQQWNWGQLIYHNSSRSSATTSILYPTIKCRSKSLDLSHDKSTCRNSDVDTLERHDKLNLSIDKLTCRRQASTCLGQLVERQVVCLGYKILLNPYDPVSSRISLPQPPLPWRPSPGAASPLATAGSPAPPLPPLPWFVSTPYVINIYSSIPKLIGWLLTIF
jgi:hypothetical protein